MSSNDKITFTVNDVENITIKQILKDNDLSTALDYLKTTDKKHTHLWRHLAVDYVEMIKHLMVDERSLDALVVARNHADGIASNTDLYHAYEAAKHVAWNCYNQNDPDTQSFVHLNAAWAAAGCAATNLGPDRYNSAWAAREAADSAYAAAYIRKGLVNIDIRTHQKILLIKYCQTGVRN